jgi:glycosyltransferase involved in cell wall biosynthesis
MKKILVLISTYNGEKFLNEQIDSVLSQVCVQVDLLIRDDNSTDASVRIIQEYMKHHSNISLIESTVNLGACKSFLNLLSNCSLDYDYYAFCDQDDVWMENKLYKAIEYMKGDNLGVAQLYCSAASVTNEELNTIFVLNNDITKLDIYRSVADNRTVGCTTVFNRALIDIFRKTYHIVNHEILMHDQWLYLLCSAFGEVYFDTNSYIYYRQHSTNVLGVNSEANLTNRIRKALDVELINLKKRKIISQLMNLKDVLSIYKENRKLLIEIERFLRNYNRSILNRLFYVVNSKFKCYSNRRSSFFKINYILKRL